MRREAPPPSATTAGGRLTGLPPLAAADARVLVLGSMPGAASLRARQYYAHPQNRFWPFMAAVTGNPAVQDRARAYEDRVRLLLAAGLAVWDVLRHCERPGSLDADIVTTSEIANDFAGFFAAHRQLRAVFLNGGKAASAFARHVQPWLLSAHPQVMVGTLPSTSPANASQPMTAKLAAWMRVAEALSRPPAPGGGSARD